MSDNQHRLPDDADRTEQLPAADPVHDTTPLGDTTLREDLGLDEREPVRPAEPVPSVPVATVSAPPTTAPRRRGPRVGTVVWGLVVIALGIGILGTIAGFRIDFGLAVIVLLGAAGLALVVGSLVTSLRRRP